MKGLYTIAAGIGLTLSIICGSSALVNTSYGYTEGDVANGGSITGTVTFEGNVPAIKMLNVNKDKEACGHGKTPSEALIISKDTKGIKNVVVSIKNITEGKKFNTSDSNPVLDQKGCKFIPHLLVIPAGTTVDILNSDNVMHNVHSYAIKNSAFNEGVTGGGKLPKKFDFPEEVKIKCDVHKWMGATIVVRKNPYYTITDENGNFKLDDVPAGTYNLKAWHEKLGKKVAEVTVESGKEAKADFALTKKKKRKRKRKRKKKD